MGRRRDEAIRATSSSSSSGVVVIGRRGELTKRLHLLHHIPAVAAWPVPRSSGGESRVSAAVREGLLE
jgi:hypothetical protein